LDDVLWQVQQTIDQHDLLAPGEKVVVGVSGGPDSLCLLHVLNHLQQRYDVSLHVAHLDHGTRGGESRADARFVHRTAKQWKLDVTLEEQDVPALACEHKLPFEEAARRIRYAFLARVAMQVGATKVAVGHNADDQAETVLMHFLRGSGPAGLRGMLSLTPLTDYRLLEPFLQDGGVLARIPGQAELAVIRPLIDVPRAAIEQYCIAQNLQPRFDRSNLDTTYFRNRLRHELLPLLETANPGMRQRLRHTASVVAADYELLTQLQAEVWPTIVRSQSADAVAFDLAVWRALPVSLQRSVLRRAVFCLRHTLRDLDFVHIEDARRVALRGTTGDQATLPRGLMLSVGYDRITIADEGHSGVPPDEPLLETSQSILVYVPGVTELPGSPWVLDTQVLSAFDLDRVRANDECWTAFLDADALARPLELRTRQPGDRFCPQGMDGRRVKVSDFLVNAKVPRVWRDEIPLLVSAGEIAWVCGRRLGEQYLVSEKTRRVVRFVFHRLDGSGFGASEQAGE